MVEYAFPVLEADEEAGGPRNIVATLPNKTRLTLLSIMVCDTLSSAITHPAKGAFRPRVDNHLYFPQVPAEALQTMPGRKNPQC